MSAFKGRITFILLILVACLISFAPNFIDFGPDSVWGKTKIKYGLDIQGGLHLVMGVDVKSVLTESTRRTMSTLQENLNKQNFTVNAANLVEDGKSPLIKLEFAAASSVEKAKALVESEYNAFQVLEEQETSLTLKYRETYLNDLVTKTLEQAVETIRNRIDEFGVSEPIIAIQGTDRIMVQLPGISDASKAKDLINRTAKLEFQMVENPPAELEQWIKDAETAGTYSTQTLKYSEYVAKLNQDLKAKLPANTEILFAKDENAKNMDTGRIPYLVRTDTMLGGDALKDAFVTMDEYNQPVVSLGFNPTGAKRFGDLTGENVGRPMAIVLDRVVYSAPVIQNKIPDGRAQITLGRGGDYNAMMQEASTISMALRAGALPATLEQLEERTVGPTLGADSVAKGKKAVIVTAIIICIFMVAWYRSFGVVANIALMLNVFMILAVLTALGATLTLPGIAGIALTLGTAVDANIIIFERIKEELAKGNSLKKAIDDGFGFAFTAILDSNLTSALTSIVLIYFNNGPIRGFAVTLLIGLATSMFTAITVTKLVLDILVTKVGVKKLAI